MRAFGRNTTWEARLLAGVVAAAVWGGATQAWSAQSIILTNSAGKSASGYVYYSPGVADVLKMVDAKVDPEVVKAYIKNSSVAYNPSAAEVIALKNRGVPPELLTAMLQRGGELRSQGAQGQYAAQGQPPYPPPGYPGAQAAMAAMPPYPYDYGMNYGLYPADYYGYGYPYGGYPYGGYPYGWWYNSFWPFYSFFPDNGFGFDRFHHHGDIHNLKGSPRFQNFDFNRNSSARFQNFDFNRANFNPRIGMSQLGVPSRAFGPGAFAGGSSAVAFLGRNGGSAGAIRPPGGAFAPAMRGGFAFRSGGGGRGGGGHGGGHGGGGGHR